MDGLKSEADSLYLSQDFQGSQARYLDAIGTLEELSGRATQLKDRALLWVYLVEWLATTGTLLLVGFTLWILMVRRKLYAEVGSTKFR